VREIHARILGHSLASCKMRRRSSQYEPSSVTTFNPAPQHTFKLSHERGRKPRACLICRGHEQVDVALIGGLAPRDGSEHPHVAGTVPLRDAKRHLQRCSEGALSRREASVLQVDPRSASSTSACRNWRSAASAGRKVFFVRRSVRGLATGMGTPANSTVTTSRQASA
jgi:hypothetical protein